MKPPTDFKLLRAIYDRHLGEYESELARSQRNARIFVPIDVSGIANALGVHVDTVVGRLYHHLDPKYAPPAEPGATNKRLFSLKVGTDVNCVNFPMLEAVLAGLWQERRRDSVALWAALVSAGIAIASLVVAIIALS